MKFFKKFFTSLVMVMMVLFSSLALVSCEPDPDPIDEFNDYYVEFSIKDRGTLTNQEASQMTGELNAMGFYIDDSSRSEAVHYFDEWARELSRDLNKERYDFDCSLYMKLMNEKKNSVAQHTLTFSSNGCRLD